MKYNNLSKKTDILLNYIKDNKLEDKLIDSSRPSKYTIENYYNLYQLLQESNGSYGSLYRIINYTLDNINCIPKKTSLHTFKSKLSKLDISANIYNKWINDNKNEFIKGDLSIDSMTIFNKSNSNIASSYTYKGKNAIKISHIINEDNIPLICSIDPATKHDSLIAENLISNQIDLFKDNKITLLGDKGYDSNKLRDLLTDNNCYSIIPLNKRRSDIPEIKQLKLQLKAKNEKKQRKLMKKQKQHRKILIAKKKELQKLKNINEVDKISINNLNDIIKQYEIKIDKIKEERHLLPNNLKNTISNEVYKYKQNNNICKCINFDNLRKCPSCNEIKICINCNICNKCNKNLTYYKGLTNDEIERYKKRIHVEHVNSHLKYGRVSIVRDRKTKMLIDTVYNRYLDLMLIWQQKQIYEKKVCMITNLTI
jgi:hypothetical protein